ncbi:hypothetical protein HDU67_001228, partial [Dinochytrium kinnereticum]
MTKFNELMKLETSKLLSNTKHIHSNLQSNPPQPCPIARVLVQTYLEMKLSDDTPKAFLPPLENGQVGVFGNAIAVVEGRGVKEQPRSSFSFLKGAGLGGGAVDQPLAGGTVKSAF